MRSARALAASSKTICEPSTFTARVASPAERIAKARCTTTSDPFTASWTLARSSTSPWRYSVFFQPTASVSNGQRAMPMIRLTPRDRSSALTRAMPRSPVAPVTVTVSPSVAISGLAWEDDRRRVLLHHDLRHHRLKVAASRALQGVLHRLELGELLQVLDRGEDEAELIASAGLEGVRGSQPAQVDALLAVATGLHAGRRLGDEEKGVEADLGLLGRDPARERNEAARVGQRDVRLLRELAPPGLGRVAVLVVHRPAGEHPGAAHEALLRVALDQQHLRAVSGVAEHDHRGRLPRRVDRAGVQLLPMVRHALNPLRHRAQPTLANLAWSW